MVVSTTARLRFDLPNSSPWLRKIKSGTKATVIGNDKEGWYQVTVLIDKVVYPGWIPGSFLIPVN